MHWLLPLLTIPVALAAGSLTVEASAHQHHGEHQRMEREHKSDIDVEDGETAHAAAPRVARSPDDQEERAPQAERSAGTALPAQPSRAVATAAQRPISGPAAERSASHRVTLTPRATPAAPSNPAPVSPPIPLPFPLFAPPLPVVIATRMSVSMPSLVGAIAATLGVAGALAVVAVATARHRD